MPSRYEVERHRQQRVGDVGACAAVPSDIANHPQEAAMMTSMPLPNRPRVRINHIAVPRDAPSATLMPISRVRRETTNDVTPYTPTSASKIASSSNRGAGRAWSLRAGRPVAARVDLANRIVHGMLEGPEATTPLCRSAGSGLENRQQVPRHSGDREARASPETAPRGR